MIETMTDAPTLSDLEADEVFTIDVEGYEGPLHLLLDMARRQKVDLLHVSITELADQYIAFIENAREHRIDLAADYLLMASWLAYLKSRLLLPKVTQDPETGETPEDMATRLAFRLKRLEAMRRAGQALMERHILGRDVFVRGAPEQPKVLKTTEYDTTMWHLMQAFGAIRGRKSADAPHSVDPQYVLPLETARDSLRRLPVKFNEWESLDDIRRQIVSNDDIPAPSATASVFSAALELTRDGEFDVRQETHFGPLYLKRFGDHKEEAA